uniref:Calcium voltage-gated channel auxiliary subunit alpha2delta 3 n=1 Tax=Fundulus heteroclitus TaxID=8078 RepID=A0A3Q2PY81_FUNHE
MSLHLLFERKQERKLSVFLLVLLRNAPQSELKLSELVSLKDSCSILRKKRQQKSFEQCPCFESKIITALSFVLSLQQSHLHFINQIGCNVYILIVHIGEREGVLFFIQDDVGCCLFRLGYPCPTVFNLNGSFMWLNKGLIINTNFSHLWVAGSNPYSAIVNGVYWSEALNKVFVDNFERDPSLIWQYFGSAKGFFRQYPGIKWKPDEHGVIAFDCRNRKWYIQAATSPKDVVILVDVSGSMKGLRLTIARQTVSSILDTLGDDDFFNIIAYNEELHYVESCLNGTLVQADVTNKDHFREHLDKLFAQGIGMLDIALTEAFNLLSDFNKTGRGSECSQAIMLVTDGAVDTYDAIFEKYNWPERKVRIFPYLIGRESAFADNLKWMACANKGYFTQISTLADVQENVMEYLHVLSRPKVIDQEHDTVWTEAYIDSTVNGLFMCMKLNVTECVPTLCWDKIATHGYEIGVQISKRINSHEVRWLHVRSFDMLF